MRPCSRYWQSCGPNIAGAWCSERLPRSPSRSRACRRRPRTRSRPSGNFKFFHWATMCKRVVVSIRPLSTASFRWSNPGCQFSGFDPEASFLRNWSITQFERLGGFLEISAHPFDRVLRDQNNRWCQPHFHCKLQKRVSAKSSRVHFSRFSANSRVRFFDVKLFAAALIFFCAVLSGS